MMALGGRGNIAPIHSWPRHQMGVCGQRNAPAALCPGKGPPVPIVQEAGWAPEPFCTQRLEEKILCPCRGSNPDRPVVQSVVRHYTAWATRLLPTHTIKYNYRKLFLSKWEPCGIYHCVVSLEQIDVSKMRTVSIIRGSFRGQTSETSVYTNETTRRYIPVCSHLHIRLRENLKYYIGFHVLLCVIW
jgi:hypothetical protein